MEIMKQEFPTTDSALTYIGQEVLTYYEFMYPDILDTNRMLIEEAIHAMQADFQKNIFPEMKVRWDVYPDHIGHVESNGCHRCHTDKHSSVSGKVISRDCNLCHLINAQGQPGNMEVSTIFEALDFRHPVDIKEKWKTTFCSECHKELY